MVTNKLSVCYEEDFNLWTEQMVELLRSRRFEELDIDNLLDELESMSKWDKRETGLLIDEFPENCPFAIAEVLNEDFLPAEIVDNS